MGLQTSKWRWKQSVFRMLCEVIVQRPLLRRIRMKQKWRIQPSGEPSRMNMRGKSRASWFSRVMARLDFRDLWLIRTIRGECGSSYISDIAQIQRSTKRRYTIPWHQHNTADQGSKICLRSGSRWACTSKLKAFIIKPENTRRNKSENNSGENGVEWWYCDKADYIKSDCLKWWRDKIK